MIECDGCDVCDEACLVRLWKAGDKWKIMFVLGDTEADGVYI